MAVRLPFTTWLYLLNKDEWNMLIRKLLKSHSISIHFLYSSDGTIYSTTFLTNNSSRDSNLCLYRVQSHCKLYIPSPAYELYPRHLLFYAVPPVTLKQAAYNGFEEQSYFKHGLGVYKLLHYQQFHDCSDRFVCSNYSEFSLFLCPVIASICMRLL